MSEHEIKAALEAVAMSLVIVGIVAGVLVNLFYWL
jgi:hypothetical protein